MKRKNTIWSLVLALVMVLGVIAPLGALAAQPKEKVTNHVTIHKILLDKTAYAGFTEGTKGQDENQKKYDGTKITDVQNFFAKKGGTAKEIGGVYFVVKNKAGDKFITADGTETDDESLALKGKTTADNGLVLDTSKLKGTFKIYEDQSQSKPVDKDGKDLKIDLTGTKAVPIEITLPLVNNDGVVEEAHVYPKNTEEGPKIDKNFDKDAKDAQNNDISVKETELVGKVKNLDVTPGSTAAKPTLTRNVGDKVPFKVATTIPKDAKYKVLTWSDEMDPGLVYNKESLKVKLGNTELTTNEYTLNETEKGFTLTLTDAGLKKVSEAAIKEEQTITITYSATIKGEIVPDTKLKNKVKLTYGNNPKDTKEKEPTPPEVVTGGKKFVKTNDLGVTDKDFERLVGAEFYVKNQAGDKYLITTADGYGWGDKEKDKDKLVVLTSGADGVFEIKGLAYGNYKLEEKKPPEGYAKRSGDVPFEVKEGSYDGLGNITYKKLANEGSAEYKQGTEALDALQVKNKKVSIPQTGGMGTMIFMVAGLALMGGAFIAMRKRSAEQA